MIDTILLILLGALAGTGFGVMTGLIPGVHVNNVAIVLLGLSPIISSALQDLTGLGQTEAMLMVASAIVATSMAHTFLDFIPSTFLGAPEAETALSVLPAHGMLLEGNGYSAIFLSAVGSFGAIVAGTLLLIPYSLLVNDPINGYQLLKEVMVWVLIGVVVLMLVTETKKVPYIPYRTGDGKLIWSEGRFSSVLGVLGAFLLFLTSGLLGLIALDLELSSPFGLPATSLFPLLSGLFGTSTLLESLRGGATVPLQRIEKQSVDPAEAVSSITSGSIAGSIVGFLPGMSGGVATVIAMIFRKEPKPSSVILTLSAINTANSFFVLGALFLILRPRSGAAIVVNELVNVREWSDMLPPSELSLLLMSALLASCLGFFLTLILGSKLANIMPRLPYSKVAWSIIILIALMVLAFTGPIGLLVLAVSTSLGMMAPLTGIRRSHAMGVLLLPVITMIW
ncbi:MAG: tripartite tricarboxylate transporter permease [Candidatus Thermoplasmatota archaeon]|nr:tripartite tricarboxylate transporter permease [Candidatus Thermoplasmatota archaeon]